MKKNLIILFFIITSQHIFAKSPIINNDLPIKYFSMIISEKSSFLGLKLDFIGNRTSNDNFVLNVGLGAFLYNSEWGLAYFSTPIEFLYRRQIDNTMFFEIGMGVDALMDSDIKFYMTVSPLMGMGLKLKNNKQMFIKTLKFSMAYNLKKYLNELYYPSGIALRYDIGF